jgi:excisionase family DNA binding protein
MNAEEAAASLAVHVETLRRLARRGRIPAFKVGKDWRFRRESLGRWSETQGLRSPPLARSGQLTASCASITVLIIDDDIKFCRALSRVVERLGYRATHSTDAAIGLKLVSSAPPSLVFLDLKMPGMNGPQFLSELRKTHPDLPVVIVTGFPDGELMYQAAQYAPLLLLAKPVEAVLIENTVRTVLGERQRAARAA